MAPGVPPQSVKTQTVMTPGVPGAYLSLPRLLSSADFFSTARVFGCRPCAALFRFLDFAFCNVLLLISDGRCDVLKAKTKKAPCETCADWIRSEQRRDYPGASCPGGSAPLYRFDGTLLSLSVSAIPLSCVLMLLVM